MRTLLLIGLHSFLCSISFAQYSTEFGDDISPKDTIYSLNMFINIVYDLCDTCDPCTGLTPNWLPGDTSLLNHNTPVYLANFIDHEFDPANIKGTFTKRYAEASFNNFILLGDFVTVNLPQSRITPVYNGNGFSQTQLVDAAIDLINEKGGLQTLYQHDSIQHYDGFINSGNRFKPKTSGVSNGNIDLLQIFVRNSTQHFGRLQAGGNAGVRIKKLLDLNGIPHGFDEKTIQGAIKNADLSKPASQPTEVHELAHHLLGMSNSAHMGGGSPVNVGNLVTLDHNTGGWSLIGSANSSLISCNGFERWRLNWRGPDNQSHRIACNTSKSDIRKEDGNKTFYLRDFVSTGDAVRIQLPYVDSGALSQYIWLENHQIHRNSKEDYPRYWERECRTDGTPGVYAYYQVGKDSLEGNTITTKTQDGDMMPLLTDHLVPISAEGKWDISLAQDRERMCLNGHMQPIQEYVRENPLSGYNDLTAHFFDPDTVDILNWKDHSHVLMTKRKDGILHDSLSSSGDAFDAFTDRTSMSLGTNPSPEGLVSYHHRRTNSGTIKKGSVFTDNSSIHLSGLKVQFLEQNGGVIRVDISWDFYDIKEPVLWTGDIVLHEKLNLLNGNKIVLDQNQTPNKHVRDSVTGLFAGPTYFICLENSEFVMQAKSKLVLHNLSSFILKSGSRMEMNHKSVLRVREGCTLVVEDGAELLIKGRGTIIIESGAHICIEPDALVTFQDSRDSIKLRTGYNTGVNADVLSKYNCSNDVVNLLKQGTRESSELND